jgi:predicted metal-binding protein
VIRKSRQGGNKLPMSANAAQRYLSKYVDMGKELGATDCKPVRVEDLTISERARNKCRVPRCMEYGTNANCPPYSPTSKEMMNILSEYRWCIVFKVDVVSAIIADPSIPGCLLRQEFDKGGKFRELGKSYKRTFKIASELESSAFYDGYCFSTGFAAGSCKGAFCFQRECQALTPGKPCRYPLKARPSIEAVGFDVFALARRANWDLYPIGARTSANDVPQGSLIGLVLID